MFTMAAVKPLSVSVCLLLSFLSFPFITTGTNRFADAVVSRLCAWRPKKKRKKERKTDDKRSENTETSASAMQDWDGQIYVLQIRVQLRFLVPPLVSGRSL